MQVSLFGIYAKHVHTSCKLALTMDVASKIDKNIWDMVSSGPCQSMPQ